MKNFPHRFPGLVALLCGALLVAAPYPAVPQDGSQSDTAFFETLDVHVVNVEVFVTDKKGNPIAALTRQDFEILEDGKPVEITNFYRGRAMAAPAAAQEPGELATAPAAPAEEPPPEEQRLTLAIFIDNENVRPNTRNRVLDALSGSLFFQLSKDDQVLLASYEGGALKVRQGLTRDPEKLVEVIEVLAKTGGSGATNTMDRISILRELAQSELEGMVPGGGAGGFAVPSESGTDWEGMFMQIQAYSARRYQEVERTILTLRGFVDLLAGVPGRKALLYVSDGLALRPGEALFHAWDQKARGQGGPARNIEAEARNFDATQLFEELGRHANANRVTFYPVLAAGGQNQTLTAAEQSAFFSESTFQTQTYDRRLQRMESQNLRGSMSILANATGGRATLNTVAIASALQSLQGDFESYYSLGYSPKDPGEGDHKIVVKVKDPSLKVRHRESYRAKSADERMGDRARSALEFGVGTNPLEVIVDFGELKKDEKGRFLVPILVKFPIAKLLLVPQERFHEGRVSIYVAARDPKGRMSPIQTLPAPVRVPNERLVTALGQVAGYRMSLLLREGKHQVVVGVRDELANVESVTRYVYDPTGSPEG